MNTMFFELTQEEYVKYNKFCLICERSINTLLDTGYEGPTGGIDITFHQTGIGTVIHLYHTLLKIRCDITDYEVW